MATATARLRARVGREQRKRTKAGRTRRPALDRYYARELPSLIATDFEWRVQLDRGKGVNPRRILLGGEVESVTWGDDGSSVTGNLQLHRPDPLDPSTLQITSHQLVELAVRWSGGPWTIVWTMRTKPPQVQLDQNTVSIDLEDDMALLTQTKRNWHWRTTKRRKHGYLAHELTTQVARMIGIKVRKMPRAKHRIDKLSKKNATALDVLNDIWQQEASASGRKFVIRLVNGKINITPFGYNPLLYVLGSALQQALITQVPKGDHPVTAITGHARLGKGKAAKKIKFTHIDRPAQRRLGYLHDDKEYGRVKSVKVLKDKVLHDLAHGLHVDYTAQVTTSGIPLFVNRGDTVNLDLPREGFTGDRAYVWIKTTQHTLSGTAYTTALDFVADDPYLAALKKKAKHKKQRAAKRTTRAAGRRKR